MEVRLRPASRATVLIAVGALGIALMLTLQRLRSGVDLEDEATYVAIAYRFALGDQPFVDEINPIQTASLLTRPFVELFVRLTGGTDGIMLATRALYLLACIGVACVAAKFVAARAGPALAALVCAPIVVQMPGLPNLSYHTIASLGFTAGVFAVAHTLRNGRGERWMLLAGIAHAMAVVALQVYALSVIGFVIAAILWLAPDRRLARWRLYALGVALVALLVLPSVVHVTRAMIDYAYLHSVSTHSWWDKVWYVVKGQYRILPHPHLLALALLALAVAARRRWTWPALALLAAIPWIAHAWRGPAGASCYTTVLSTLAPFLYWILRDRRSARPLLLGIWAPSFCAGFVIAWASSVHVASEGYAQIPGCIVAAIFAVEIARELLGERIVALACAWPLVVIGVFSVHQRVPYNDDVLDALDATVASGPWRGIRTTSAKRAYLTAIESDVRAFDDSGRRILFFSHFPAGYLMSRLGPASSSVWATTCLPERRWEMCTETLERDLDRRSREGVVVFDVKRTFHTLSDIRPLDRGPAHDVLEARCDKALDTPEYAVYVTR